MKNTINYEKFLTENLQNSNIPIPRRLRLLREKSGLSQKELAEKIGLCRGHYCAIENGKRPLSKGYAETLARFYEIDDRLLYDDKELFTAEDKRHLNYFYNDLYMLTYIKDTTGIEPEITKLLMKLGFNISVPVFPNGSGGLKDPRIAAKKETYVCSLCRTNSDKAYMTKLEACSLQRDIFDFVEFITKRYMKYFEGRTPDEESPL